jgi:polyisoprenoid-binding protein YceI
MATWVFEPGHTAAQFCVRHMMVTWVRGHFKDVHGNLEFDPDNPATLSMHATIAARNIWTGEPQRDEHLRSADFLDVVNHPTITFQSTKAQRVGASHYDVTGNMTIRGVTHPVTLDLHYLGRWRTPYNQAQVTRGHLLHGLLPPAGTVIKPPPEFHSAERMPSRALVALR